MGTPIQINPSLLQTSLHLRRHHLPLTIENNHKSGKRVRSQYSRKHLLRLTGPQLPVKNINQPRHRRNKTSNSDLPQAHPQRKNLLNLQKHLQNSPKTPQKMVRKQQPPARISSLTQSPTSSFSHSICLY